MVSWGQHNLPMDFSLSAHGVPIYYLPGHGGRITTGLGQALLSRGYEVVGRETVAKGFDLIAGMHEFKETSYQDIIRPLSEPELLAPTQI